MNTLADTQVAAKIVGIDAELQSLQREMKRLNDFVHRNDEEMMVLSRSIAPPDEYRLCEEEKKTERVNKARRRDFLLQHRGLTPDVLSIGAACPLCGSYDHPEPISREHLTENNRVIATLGAQLVSLDAEITSLQEQRLRAEDAQRRHTILTDECDRATAERRALAVRFNQKRDERGRILASQEILKEV